MPILNYFGIGAQIKDTDLKSNKSKPIRALPGSWYTSRELYELERRAIFSKRWLFITHQSRLKEPGDFLRFEIAGFDFIINRDLQGNIRAHHNVCRHRAYPVVEEEKGNKKIFSCKYHGWSYGINGKLARAPQYQGLEGFSKEDNGLFPIHTHLDINGFIWVNLDGARQPEIPWEQEFKDVDRQERFNQFNFDDYELDHTYEIKGQFDWKLLSDNFNECYHCKTTHPDVPTFLTIDSHQADVKDGHIQHDHGATPEQKAKGYNVNSTYYFPNVSMSVAPHFLMIQKFLPEGPSKSTMSYEVYRNKHSSDEDFHAIADVYARVMAEDKVLCERAQKNITAGVFVNGELHPRWEKAPLFFQQSVREVLTEHYKREKAAGHQIFPARQRLPDDAEISREDMELCDGLACGTEKEELAW